MFSCSTRRTGTQHDNAMKSTKYFQIEPVISIYCLLVVVFVFYGCVSTPKQQAPQEIQVHLPVNTDLKSSPESTDLVPPMTKTKVQS